MVLTWHYYYYRWKLLSFIYNYRLYHVTILIKTHNYSTTSNNTTHNTNYSCSSSYTLLFFNFETLGSCQICNYKYRLQLCDMQWWLDGFIPQQSGTWKSINPQPLSPALTWSLRTAGVLIDPTGICMGKVVANWSVQSLWNMKNKE